MTYTYKLKQIAPTAFPPPKLHQSAHPITPGDTIECDDGNWYHVVSVSGEGKNVVLHLGPDGMSAKEAILLAEQQKQHG